jgi:hypothetical protein
VLLVATRHGACVAKVRAANQLKALIVGAPEELRAELRGLTKRQVGRCARLQDRPACSPELRMTVRALRSTASSTGRCTPWPLSGCATTRQPTPMQRAGGRR